MAEAHLREKQTLAKNQAFLVIPIENIKKREEKQLVIGQSLLDEELVKEKAHLSQFLTK